MTPAPGATTIVPSSPASRPSPPGGLRPALTPTAGDTGMHRSGAGNKEDQQNKIHLTEVSTVSGDCQHGGSGLRTCWERCRRAFRTAGHVELIFGGWLGIRLI
jgi:hypothetical protein